MGRQHDLLLWCLYFWGGGGHCFDIFLMKALVHRAEWATYRGVRGCLGMMCFGENNTFFLFLTHIWKSHFYGLVLQIIWEDHPIYYLEHQSIQVSFPWRPPKALVYEISSEPPVWLYSLLMRYSYHDLINFLKYSLKTKWPKETTTSNWLDLLQPRPVCIFKRAEIIYMHRKKLVWPELETKAHVCYKL